MKKLVLSVLFVLIAGASGVMAGADSGLFVLALSAADSRETAEQASSTTACQQSKDTSVLTALMSMDDNAQSVGSCNITTCENTPGCSTSGLCGGWTDTGNQCCIINGHPRCCLLGKTVHTRNCQCLPLICGAADDFSCM